jgi:hypothetical protein
MRASGEAMARLELDMSKEAICLYDEVVATSIYVWPE